MSDLIDDEIRFSQEEQKRLMEEGEERNDIYLENCEKDESGEPLETEDEYWEKIENELEDADKEGPTGDY